MASGRQALNGSDTVQTGRDSRQRVPLGDLHLGGLHVYCNYMHKHARAPRKSGGL